MQQTTATAQEVLQHLADKMATYDPQPERWKKPVDLILKEGTLSQRIVGAMGKDPSHETIVATFKTLATCLADNKMFSL
jgi:carboxylate-amine ligase